MKPSKEEELLFIEDLKKRKEKAFLELDKKYRFKIINIINRFVHDYDTAQDLTQEVFLKVYEKIHFYKPYYTFSAWLYRVAANHAIDYLRKLKTQYVSIFHFVYEDSNGNKIKEWDIPDKVNTKEKINPFIIERALKELDDKYREILVLRFFDELSYKEISERLNVSVGTVKVRLHRAKQKMGQLLKKNKEK